MGFWDKLKPTGRTRFRTMKRLFRAPVLVLQIEYTGSWADGDGYSRDGTFWEDADPDGLLELALDGRIVQPEVR